MLTFSTIFQYISEVKTVVDTFWPTLEKIGLVFIPTSGHTGLPGPVVESRNYKSLNDEQRDLIWRKIANSAKI